MKEKDALYYSDLILYIKSLAGILKIEDEETKERIRERQKDIPHCDEKGLWTELTPFNKDLFEFVLNISKKYDIFIQGPTDLKKYPKETKELLKRFYINIAEDYSETPGARYISNGPYSGEEFRDKLLEPKYLNCLPLGIKLIIDFDGGYGYPVTFLEEVFGGMVRKGYQASDLLNNIIFISDEEPEIIEDIKTYMYEEDIRCFRRGRKKKDTE